ncbi:MAG: histidine kinase, partial [Verrucomicrobiae bacterium]|nr:histidine kinase [Verrucomicrobiae bacterium]
MGHCRTPEDESRFRWGLPLFFAGWTVMAVLMVWWLAAGPTDRADVLIALGRSEGSSWTGSARRWVETHTEVYWTYAWILLAPYIVWMSLRWALEKNRLAWRLAVHLLLGAGFIAASQALTCRLASLQPKAIFVERKDVVRRVGSNGTNEPDTVMVTRSLEWHGEPGAGARAVWERHGPLPPDTNLNPFPSVGAEGTRVFVLREDREVTNTVTSSSTNLIWRSSPGLESPHDLALRLAPVIEKQLKVGLGPGPLYAPRRFAVALDGLAYLTLIGLAQAIHFRRRLSERETQAASLEAKLTQSRLHALQAQLQPHFLFNALNGIALLVRRDPRTAEEMIASLSELLRASLSRSGRQEIPLREELELLERYLELQTMRFGDRLTVERRVDPAALEVLVPSLLFQPLVENAIRHGIEPLAEPGWVRISAICEGSDLILEVEDNGAGFDPSPLGGNRKMAEGGLGLDSVRERLAGLYEDRHEFLFQERAEGGVRVRIRIP